VKHVGCLLFDMPHTGPYPKPNECSTYHLIVLL